MWEEERKQLLKPIPRDALVKDKKKSEDHETKVQKDECVRLFAAKEERKAAFKDPLEGLENSAPELFALIAEDEEDESGADAVPNEWLPEPCCVPVEVLEIGQRKGKFFQRRKAKRAAAW